MLVVYFAARGIWDAGGTWASTYSQTFAMFLTYNTPFVGRRMESVVYVQHSTKAVWRTQGVFGTV